MLGDGGLAVKCSREHGSIRPYKWRNGRARSEKNLNGGFHAEELCNCFAIDFARRRDRR